MEPNENVVITKEGYDKLNNELNELVSIKRKEVAQRIKEAISHGDISENSEYDDAKNEQAFIEGKIQQINSLLSKAVIIDDEKIKEDKVYIGSWVLLKDLDYKEKFECQVVGSAEADPSQHRISNESPVGRAILNKKAGQTVSVKAPKGEIKYKILKITNSDHKAKAVKK